MNEPYQVWGGGQYWPLTFARLSSKNYLSQWSITFGQFLNMYIPDFKLKKSSFVHWPAHIGERGTWPFDPKFYVKTLNGKSNRNLIYVVFREKMFSQIYYHFREFYFYWKKVFVVVFIYILTFLSLIHVFNIAL